ncbi:hypothetical protein C8Q74DRAFT_1221354 [Fomes fomentarius]|nr:hypothetical protein C8Q74DRAFT_1221354 [Fomes fomentarius]
MPPSYSPCPRPCLKRTSHPSPLAPPPQDEPSTLLAIDPSILSPLVRFPHQTALAHTLGSAISYDRTPIVVSPNRCALPERGCPGRTYAPEDPHAASLRRSKRTSLSPVGGRSRHPRAAGDDYHRQVQDDDPTPRQSPRVDYHPLPPLVPDLSSSESSEESDGVASPPPEVYSSSSPYGKISLEHSLMNLTLAGTNAPSTSALSFLPHPPSPRVRPSPGSASSPSHSPSSSQSYSLSNAPSNHYKPTSPVRSRSPSSPTHSRRKPRSSTSTSNPVPVPIPGSTALSNPHCASTFSHTSALSPSYVSMSPNAGVPASPERERRSKHRDERGREHRDRSRERRDRERAERLARYKSVTETRGFEDGGCLGGF